MGKGRREQWSDIAAFVRDVRCSGSLRTAGRCARIPEGLGVVGGARNLWGTDARLMSSEVVLGGSVKRDRRDRELDREQDRERDRAMRDRDRERDRATHEEEKKRRDETQRRGEQLREAWRQHHPGEDREKDQPKNGGTA